MREYERDVPGKWWGSWGDCAGAVRWGAAPSEDNLPSFSFSLVLVAVLQGVFLMGVINLTQSVYKIPAMIRLTIAMTIDINT